VEPPAPQHRGDLRPAKRVGEASSLLRRPSDGTRFGERSSVETLHDQHAIGGERFDDGRDSNERVIDAGYGHVDRVPGLHCEAELGSKRTGELRRQVAYVVGLAPAGATLSHVGQPPHDGQVGLHLLFQARSAHLDHDFTSIEEPGGMGLADGCRAERLPGDVGEDSSTGLPVSSSTSAFTCSSGMGETSAWRRPNSASASRGSRSGLVTRSCLPASRTCPRLP